MRATYTHRYRRRTSPAREGGMFKKESKQEQAFFGSPSHESFFQPATQAIQRKCEGCKDEEKSVKGMAQSKEEEKKVLRTEDKKEEDKIKRLPGKKDEEKLNRVAEKQDEDKTLQKKGLPVGHTATGFTAGYVSTLNGKGQSLPKQQQHFFGSRMGYDFKDVKIHNDKAAATSAKEVNAKAYAIGNNIIFNEGQYNTGSNEGKKLLAHELTHVMQQEKSGQPQNVNRLQRAITYTAPTITREDPIQKVLSGQVSKLGETHPKFNGVQVNSGVEALHALFDAITKNLGLMYDPVAKKCKVDMSTINLDISANVQQLTLPSGGKWAGSYPGTVAKGCESNSSINIEMDSSPSGAAAFEKRIAADEAEHVSDLNRLAQQHINAFCTYLAGISISSSNANDCAALFNKEMGTKDGDMMKAFVRDWLAAVAVHDAPTGNHHHTTSTDARDCKLVKITANF
ncbi:MAG: DUF4157 domain-containing protein [Ferruginibacter sp.]